MNLFTDPPSNVIEDLDIVRLAREEQEHFEREQLIASRQRQLGLAVCDSVNRTTPGGLFVAPSMLRHVGRHVCRYIVCTALLVSWIVWMATAHGAVR